MAVHHIFFLPPGLVVPSQPEVQVTPGALHAMQAATMPRGDGKLVPHFYAVLRDDHIHLRARLGAVTTTAPLRGVLLQPELLQWPTAGLTAPKQMQVHDSQHDPKRAQRT